MPLGDISSRGVQGLLLALPFMFLVLCLEGLRSAKATDRSWLPSTVLSFLVSAVIETYFHVSVWFSLPSSVFYKQNGKFKSPYSTLMKGKHTFWNDFYPVIFYFMISKMFAL